MNSEPEQIPWNDDTRPSAEVVNLAREQNKRRLDKANDYDLLRALYALRPTATERRE
jgi:hypothetical protein